MGLVIHTFILEIGQIRYYSALLIIMLVFTDCSNEKVDNSDKPTDRLEAKNFQTVVDENPSSNLFLGTIESNMAAEFYIISENPQGALSVDTLTGNISIADENLYDYETNPVIEATVQVSTIDEYVESTITINLNNIDDIEFRLTDSKQAYIDAEIGNWIEITLEEYDILATELNYVVKSGFTEDENNTFDTFSGITPTNDGIIVANDNSVTIPENSYCFAFKYNPRSSFADATKVKISTTAIDNGYSSLGSVLPLHEDSIFLEESPNAFVLKGNNSPLSGVGFLAVYSKSFIGFKTLNYLAKYYTNYGDVSDLNTFEVIPSRVFLYQSLSTTQKQWD